MVVNETSKRVIEETLLYSACTSEEKTHFEYTDIDEGFYALLGSTNGGSTNGASSMRMLRDLKEALGFRTVERVVIVGERHPDDKEVQSRTLMILLSSKRGVELDYTKSSGKSGKHSGGENVGVTKPKQKNDVRYMLPEAARQPEQRIDRIVFDAVTH